jgi:hypothetical protein
MVQPGQASSSIEGFATSMSANIGNAVDFKINTDSTNYRIDIYRLGYYGGDGATLVTSITHPAGSAVVQPSPLTDSATRSPKPSASVSSRSGPGTSSLRRVEIAERASLSPLAARWCARSIAATTSGSVSRSSSALRLPLQSASRLRLQ